MGGSSRKKGDRRRKERLAPAPDHSMAGLAAILEVIMKTAGGKARCSGVIKFCWGLVSILVFSRSNPSPQPLPEAERGSQLVHPSPLRGGARGSGLSPSNPRRFWSHPPRSAAVRALLIETSPEPAAESAEFANPET